MFKANYKPNSAADISGGENYPGIRGRVKMCIRDRRQRFELWVLSHH